MTAVARDRVKYIQNVTLVVTRANAAVQFVIQNCVMFLVVETL